VKKKYIFIRANNKICIHKIIFPRKVYLYRLPFVPIFQLYRGGPFSWL